MLNHNDEKNDHMKQIEKLLFKSHWWIEGFFPPSKATMDGWEKVSQGANCVETPTAPAETRHTTRALAIFQLQSSSTAKD